jgi:hypothetical protein
MAKVKHEDGPFQLLIVVRARTMVTGEFRGVHSTIASFPTKAAADIAFANVAELVNAGGEYAVTKLYI